MGKITKSDILSGSDRIVKREVESLGGEMYFAVLGDAELTEIHAKMAKGQRVKSAGKENKPDITMDAGEALMNTREARYEAIAKSLSNEKQGEDWSPEEVANLGGDVVDELSEIVADISGVLNRPAFQSWERPGKAEEDEGANQGAGEE